MANSGALDAGCRCQFLLKHLCTHVLPPPVGIKGYFCHIGCRVPVQTPFLSMQSLDSLINAPVCSALIHQVNIG